MGVFDEQKQSLMEPVYPDTQEGMTDEENRSVPGMSKEQIMAAPIEQLISWEVADLVMGRQKVSEDWRTQRRQVWDQAWKDYRQIPNRSGKAVWQQSMVMPLITKATEVITANMHGAVMGPEMPAEFQSRGRPDLDEQIAKHNRILGYDFEKSKFKVEWTDFLRGGVLLGTMVGKIDYVKQSEQVMIKERRKPSMMDSILQRFGKEVSLERFVPKDTLVRDYARFRNRDLYDIYPQPEIADFSKDAWVIEKGKITNKELMDGALDPDPYYRLDNITPELLMSGGQRQDEYDPEKQARRLAFLDFNIRSHNLEPDQAHDLYEYYGPIPAWFLDPQLKDDPQKKYDTVPGWVWVVDGRFVVRMRISPWRDAEPPYVKGNYIRVPGQFYGIGIGELLASLQVEKNELRNLNIDNINITMNKIIAVMKDKVPQGEWGRLVSEPGALWVFQGIDDIKKAFQTVEFPSQGPDIWNAMAQVDREAEETGGAVKATLAVGGDSSEAGGGTFRGQLLNKQAATERFMLYARVLEVCGLGDAMKKFYQRIYQFKSYQEVDEILGPNQSKDFELMSPEVLEKVAKLVPLGVLTLENKGIKIAQMGEFTKNWMAAPFFKQLEMARKQWIEMGFPSPDDVLFSDEEMKAFNDFKRQLSGEGMGTPPPGSPGIPGGSGPSPIAGPMPGPMKGMPRPAMMPNGPGAKPMDAVGARL